MTNSNLDQLEQVSLCEALDRILNKGVVVTGDLMISVADIDLIYLGLRCILTSIETAREAVAETEAQEGKHRNVLEIGLGRGMELSNAGQ